MFQSTSSSVLARWAYILTIATSTAGCSSYSGGPESQLKAESYRSTSDPDVARIQFEAAPLLVSAYGDDVSIPVPFQNPSATSSLKLEIRSKSCDCAGFSITPDVVEPGGHGVMTLETTFGNATEERELRLRFDTGLQQPNIMEFDVAIRAFPAIEFRPQICPTLAIPFGKSAELKFDVICHQPEGDTPVEPEISSDTAELTLTLVGHDDQVDYGVRRRTTHCVATIAIPSQAEFEKSPVIQRSRIDVRTGDHTAALHVSWRPENMIRAEPKSLLLNTRQAGQSHQLELTSETAFSIVALDTPLEELAVKASLGDKRKHHMLSVSFEGISSGEKPRKLMISATTDHPEAKQIAIPVYILE